MDVVSIRRATGGDAPGIAALHVCSWQAAYRGILPNELLEGLSVPERELSWQAILGESGDRRLTLVAEDADESIAGFCSAATPSRDADALTAEIGALYVDPGRWRRGVGTALLTAALEELVQREFRDVILWVLPQNRPALALYAHYGFEVEEGLEKREERSGQPVIRLRANLRPASRR